MTQFPTGLDTDLDIPPVNDNIVDVGVEVINDARSAIFAIEANIGVGAQGTLASIADRLTVSIDPAGVLKSSALISAGLIALPITNSQISSTAAIAESKLALTYSTSSLNTAILVLDAAVDVLNDFVAITGIKINPHIDGSAFRHKLSDIDVDNPLNRVNINLGSVVPRNITNANTFTAELSNDLLVHTRADGVLDTTTPPAKFAHNASGVFINTGNFASIPATATDVQSFAEFVDSSSLVLLGSRTQNLFSNGIPRSSRSQSLTNQQAGEAVLDPCSATTYLLFGGASSPVDDIDHGDDVILLTPSSPVLTSDVFDAQFSQVRPGDFISVVYADGYSAVVFTIDSTRKFLNGTTRNYLVRINGKNLLDSTTATVRIDRPFYHDTKFNVLAPAIAHNTFSELPSLIIGHPRGASTIGVNFSPDQLDATHYNLYLTLYPTGNPIEKTIFLPAIDVTGNLGLTPDHYTLDQVIANINDQFRVPGFNYRFIAFKHNGQIGIMLADHYNDASFSIISGIVDNSGNYTATSNDTFPHNIIDNFNGIDPFGMGLPGTNVASPSFLASYSSALSALTSPTIINYPLKRNFYYVDGVEKDVLAQSVFMSLDGYGDGYWPATITARQVFGGRVETTYEIDLDLSTSNLKKGKTLVVQPAVAVSSISYVPADYGRFLIKNVVFNNCPCPNPTATTTLTVYDAIHGVGSSPASSSVNIPVFIYFSDDTVSFDVENVGDPNSSTSFKRFFETYVDVDGRTFNHERARFNITGTDVAVDTINNFTLFSDAALAPLNIVNVSPKLRGYSFNQYKKITLFINSYDQPTGLFNGYLVKFESPSTYSRQGPVAFGKKGDIVRFYDETNIDYIDIIFNLDDAISSFTNSQIDIQLFPSLELNQEKFLLDTCQLNDTTKKITYLIDRRQYGNISEKQLSDSALDFINSSDRLVRENGVIKGFDLVSILTPLGETTTLTSNNQFNLRGGTALINGKIVEFNDTTLNIPIVQESLFPTFATNLNNIRWYLCINDRGEHEFIASTDYDVSLTGTYGSLDHNRIFYARNPAVAAPAYPVRSAYLENLVSTMKDVVPLYVINATVAFTTTWNVGTATITSIRRFIENGHNTVGSNFFTLGTLASFRSLLSLKTFMTELTGFISYNLTSKNRFGTTVYVQDILDASSFTFDFPTKTKFIGNNSTFTISSSATIVKNTEFNNLSFSISSDVGFALGSDITFDHCNISYTYDATSDGQFTSGQLSNPKKACLLSSTTTVSFSRTNIAITNCTFTTNKVNHFPFISFLINDEIGYHENINISNNKFALAANAEDKRSIISFISTLLTVPTLLQGPRIANILIKNNVCDKNQLIILSATLNGSNLIANLLVPINVIIDNNICGAICYLLKQDIPLSTANVLGTISDKFNTIQISKNVCKFIYCGLGTGFMDFSGTSHVSNIITGNNIFSCSTIINNNTCSWMYLGEKVPANTSIYSFPDLIIDNNIFHASILSYLSPYLNGFTALQDAILLFSTGAST